MRPSPQSKRGQRVKRGRGKEASKAFASSPFSVSPKVLSPSLMRRWPLPQPDDDADKEGRGRVLVVGGSTEIPGGVMLAAIGALRAGAGKLQIATCRSVAQAIAVRIPEARVIALPETRKGAIAASAAKQVAAHARDVQAILIGPGMMGEDAVEGFMKSLLPHLRDVAVILDAAALSCFAGAPGWLKKSEATAILTPHAGEMAKMLDIEIDEVRKDPLAIATRAAKKLRAVIALKGRETFIVSPEGEAYLNRAGNVGLATSGSGDTLSGIIAGLAARGTDPLRAAAWGVYLHAKAGDRLAKHMGRLGFLARELLDKIPPLMSELSKVRNT